MDIKSVLYMKVIRRTEQYSFQLLYILDFSISRGFALGRTGNDNTATLALGTPGKNLTFVIAEKRSANKQRARFFLP